MPPHSMHDREGCYQVPENGFALDTLAISEKPQYLDYRSLNSKVNWILRVNWGYGGTGTLPNRAGLKDFIEGATDYLLKSSGYQFVIIGNEPNYPVEYPNGEYLDPEYVAWIFKEIRGHVKRMKGEIRFITTPVAPYRIDSGVKWREYLNRMLLAVEHYGGAEGIGIHAYARSMDPSEATSDARMDPPLEADYKSFRTYLNALSEVPSSLRHLPAFITEFNVIPDWEDKNTGIIKAVYQEIANHNRIPDVQQVIDLTMFRWKHYEGQRWGIENKPNLLQDFREAVANVEPTPEDNQIFIPGVSTGTQTPPEPDYPFYIDQEAVEYGVKVEPAQIGPSDKQVWKAVEIQFLNPEESQGRRHFYFDTVDENGNRLVGVILPITWPDKTIPIKSEEKKGEPYSANFPFTPGKNAFSSVVESEFPSDRVTGAGMGYDTPSGFNPGIHTSVFVKYQRFAVREGSTPKPVINLIHPVVNPAFRTITQRFGENPEDYARFNIKGHTGIDFGTPVGSDVQAVDAGVVVEAGVLPDYGRYVKIVHPWGESLYAHLEAYLVQHGENVGKGEAIAFSGNTGNSTGPHLHFAMRVNPYQRNDGWAGFSDPEPYLYPEVVEEPGEEVYTPEQITKAIKQAADEQGLDWKLMVSQAWAESSYDPYEEGGGLFQVSEETWFDIADEVGAKDIDNPLDNARVAAYYLKYLYNYYDENIYKAVLAFNHGMGNVDRGVEPSALTKEYVNKIFHGRDLLNALGVQK